MFFHRYLACSGGRDDDLGAVELSGLVYTEYAGFVAELVVDAAVGSQKDEPLSGDGVLANGEWALKGGVGYARCP